MGKGGEEQHSSKDQPAAPGHPKIQNTQDSAHTRLQSKPKVLYFCKIMSGTLGLYLNPCEWLCSSVLCWQFWELSGSMQFNPRGVDIRPSCARGGGQTLFTMCVYATCCFHSPIESALLNVQKL
eukprot:1321919-Amphidinium_carterae.1